MKKMMWTMVCLMSVVPGLALGSTLMDPAALVGTRYHSPNDRTPCFDMSTDGIINSDSVDMQWDTYFAEGHDGTDFAGLIYSGQIRFDSVIVDLGKQFGDGGNWAATPFLYILKNPVDTDTIAPETNANWVQVSAVPVGNPVFDAEADANPSPVTPITFDLTGLSNSDRTGYGWAVGGVAGDGLEKFISITELRGFGQVVPEPCSLILLGLGALLNVRRRS